MSKRGCLCLFAKPTQAGVSKTRLAKSIGEDAAARFAEASLQDTLLSLREYKECDLVLCFPDSRELKGSDGYIRWLQGDGDLGEKLERAFLRGLQNYPWVLALGADSPGMPTDRIEGCIQHLEDEQSDAVLGPAEDGGYYALGLKRCSVGLLKNLPWSTSHTAEATQERLESHHFNVKRSARWFDVDEMDDLLRLEALLLKEQIVAPSCSKFCSELFKEFSSKAPQGIL